MKIAGEATLVAPVATSRLRRVVAGTVPWRRRKGTLHTLEDVLTPLGLTPATLKAQGRYAEDVY